MRARIFHRLISLLALALLVTTVTLGKIQSPLSANLVRQIAATVTLAPTSALPNQYVAVTGEDFTTGGAVTIASISLDGTVVDTSKINFGAPVTVDSSGNFVTNLVVPINSPALTPGSYSVLVVDSAGISASATPSTASPTISVSPTSSRAGAP